jgi:hypothetical protein
MKQQLRMEESIEGMLEISPVAFVSASPAAKRRVRH